MKQLAGLGRSFRCALRGIACGIKEERNLRIHLAAAGGALGLGVIYRLPAGLWALLLLLIALVLTAELVNSAVERAVDLTCGDYHTLARDAKDIAAGAVLVTAVAAVVIGLLLFLRPEGLRRLFAFIRERPLVFWPCALGYGVLALAFISGLGGKKC